MSQSKMDLWGDFLSLGVFKLLLPYFCGDKKVRCINIDKHIQANTHIQIRILVCLYHATNSNSSNNNYNGFMLKLYCSLYNFQCCFTVNRNFLSSWRKLCLIEEHRQYFEAWVLRFVSLSKAIMFSCWLERGFEA